MSTIFQKIIDKEIPATIVFENERVLAFRDIAPQATHHILVIPKKPIATLNDATAEDQAVLGELMLVAAKLAKELGFAESGYRVSMNCNADGGQEVFHIHLHLMGGNKLGKMC